MLMRKTRRKEWMCVEFVLINESEEKCYKSLKEFYLREGNFWIERNFLGKFKTFLYVIFRVKSSKVVILESVK